MQRRMTIGPLLIALITLIVILALGAASMAQGAPLQLSLDAEYTGKSAAHPTSPPTNVNYVATGENANAPSGLTVATLWTEGAYDWWYGTAGLYQTDPGVLTLNAPGGDRLVASFQGQGTLHLFEGLFTICGGGGRFAGSTGGGTFRVLRTGPFSENGPMEPFPVAISIRGTATDTSVAIPEPGSLALLGLAGVALLRRGVRRPEMKRNQRIG